MCSNFDYIKIDRNTIFLKCVNLFIFILLEIKTVIEEVKCIF